MTDPRELLDAYASAEVMVENTYGLFEPTIREHATPEAFAALRAVLDVHKPIDRGAGPQCAGCATHATFTSWPCRTVQAITTALEADR